MNGGELQNANPIIYDVAGADGDGADGLLGGKGVPAWLAGFDDDDDTDADGSSSSSSDGGGPGGGGGDAYDADEVFEILRRLRDPEHPLTLEQLNVIARENISLDDAASRVAVRFTPTVPHCSMATLIGLCIRVKLLRSLPRRFKVTITITPGAHASEHAVNKQLADKERVAAALENKHLLDVVDKCIAKTDEPSDALLALARAPLFVDPGAKEPFLYDGLLQ